VWVLALIAFVTTATSCSSSGSSKPPATTTPGTVVPLGATFHGKADWTGSVKLAGTYTVDYRSNDKKRNSCRGLAHPPATGGTFVVPFPTTLDGYHISAIAAASPFHGPGRYGAESLENVAITLTKDAAPMQQFVANSRSTVGLTVNADGGGSFNFLKLAGTPSGTLSGSLRWTCSR